MVTIAIDKLEADSLRLAFGTATIEVGRLALHKIAAQLHLDGGRPQLVAFEAASAELTGVTVHGPLAPSQAAAGPWSLAALATADGSIRAKILDAHLLFDADVTVPIRYGQIDFDDATVEHVGPDSRMGISPQGLYVDAPNGRSDLYRFASQSVAGVEFERRDALLGPWISDRGKLKLQPFGEALLSQASGAQGGFTEQAKQMFARTSLSGDVQLGDGRVAAPGVQAELVGRAEGHNLIRLQSDAVGRRITGDMAALSVKQAILNAKDVQLACAEMTGALTLRVDVDGAQMRFLLKLENSKLSGLRFTAP